MNSIKWTRKELYLLKKYNNCTNEYAAMPKAVKDSTMVQKILELEAMLIITNKLVIGYQDNHQIGIFTFNEALRKEQYFIKQGKIFTFHPINYLNMKHYACFLEA